MIKIENLSKSYGDVNVLHDIDLSIETGQIYGLVGTSGVGKSTLLGCINGLEEYQKGSIRVDDVKVETLNEKNMREFRKNMGMIFQHSALVNRKTVFKNIALPLECWGYDRIDIKKRVYRLAEMVGLEDKLESKPEELSGGQKQRVAIARALTLEPKYLLSDESTSALDPNTTISILKLMDEIRKEMGLTVIVVTHEMQVVQNICERMAILEGGMVSAEGSVTDLFVDKPESLIRLLGEGEKKLPSIGVNISLSLVTDSVENPVVFELSRMAKKEISLVDASFFNSGMKKSCNMTLNIRSKDDVKMAIDYMQKRGINYKVLNSGGDSSVQ
ncbi:MAG: methionine ABC transporter ATP-binding protein [Clostridioides sp.]|jgi:D-methionine transport system ATP-binding protein|nr:methionine ABC transporter ATP-binding protein [Clostridioides sp.]